MQQQAKAMVMTLPTGPAGHGDSALNWGHALEVINGSPAPCAFQKVIKSLITEQVAIKWSRSSSSSPEPRASGPTTQGFCFEPAALLCLGFDVLDASGHYLDRTSITVWESWP